MKFSQKQILIKGHVGCSLRSLLGIFFSYNQTRLSTRNFPPISQTGGTYKDIKARITKPRQVIDILRPVLRMTAISTNTKLKIFNSNVKSVLLYGSETWRVISNACLKIQTFINRCLLQIL